MKGHEMRKRFILTCLWSAAVLLMIIIAAPFIGPHSVSLGKALSDTASVDARVIFWIRTPRVLMAALAGGTLAVSGVAFQALLRNPLAEPFTLGVSSGASLGAVLAILTGADVLFLGFSAVPLFAFAGALLAVFIVYILARGNNIKRGKKSKKSSRSRVYKGLTNSKALPTSTLLLAGVCLAFTFHSLILLAHYLADYGNSYRMLRWLMGGLDITSMKSILQVFPFSVAGLAFIGVMSRSFNVLSGGEEVAQSRGINVRQLQKYTYFSASLSTAAVVTAVGPVGFVGLMVPHVTRRLVGPDHRLLIPASFGLGGVFLVVCDTMGRTLLAPTELPVGVVTALVGGPFAIILILKSRRTL